MPVVAESMTWIRLLKKVLLLAVTGIFVLKLLRLEGTGMRVVETLGCTGGKPDADRCKVEICDDAAVASSVKNILVSIQL